MSQLAANVGRKRGKGRPFVKGQSGNPGGRSRAPLDVQQLAREYTSEAVLALVEALRDPRHKVSAAVAILDRAWGRPQQQISGDANRPLAVDFRWNDGSAVAAVENQVIEAVALAIEAEPAPAD